MSLEAVFELLFHTSSTINKAFMFGRASIPQVLYLMHKRKSAFKVHHQEEPKLLSCAFLLDVLCSYRKTDKFTIMARCFKCPHYVRFIREMDKEDEEMDKEVEDAFANPEKYLRGQDDDRR